ncbi:MAG: Spi family protease inhibitor [Bacteroidales bacterium]|nr:Spi family protease inhibitor [Bacteroidales bacterium]
MKHIITIIITILCIINIYAEPVDINTAKKIALNVIHHKSNDNFEIEKVITYKERELITTYVVIFKEKGWVLVSADDDTVPVFAYSTTGNFNADNLPPAKQEWIKHFNESVYDVVKNNNQIKETKYKWENILQNKFEDKSKSVSPLLLFVTATDI